CLAESKALVVDSSGKAQLHRQTGADVLDMETVAVAKVALERNVPFLAVRAIADPVNMSLPLAVVHALNGDGEVELPRLFSYLLRHPGELPDLIRLGRYFNSAKKTLKQTARYLDSLTRTGRL
ncbi:MAG: phosphorylase family protein, partial [Gammaproteobacteria bacterium]